MCPISFCFGPGVHRLHQASGLVQKVIYERLSRCGQVITPPYYDTVVFCMKYAG